MQRIFVSRPKSVLVTSRHVVHRTFDHTGHVHYFFVLDTIFLTYLTYTAQRVSTLCRSVASSEWRFGRALDHPQKNVDLDESISFLDHVNLGCTQRDCKPNEIIIDPYREMFESPISAEVTENYQGGKSLTQRRLRGPPTWRDMLENVLRGTASWQKKKWINFATFQVRAWMICKSRRA